jgi:glyoxylase-like metal-dependent hydrolase (beta-lactamase superfamily II)
VAHIEHLGPAQQDLRHVILTHLDYDHAAGIADFPRAAVHLYALEWHAARQGKSWRDRLRSDRRQLARHRRWQVNGNDGRDYWYGLP